MPRQKNMHTVFGHQIGNIAVEVLCHFSAASDRDDVIRETKAKVALLDDKLQSIVRAAVEANVTIDGIDPADCFAPYRLAMIDAQEPVLYLAGFGSFVGQEIHVNLTHHMDYTYSELFEK